MSMAQASAPAQALRGNVVDYLLERSGSPVFAARPYIVGPDRTWSYGDLTERVGRTANALKSLGLKPGERVLFSVMDGIDFPALFLAILKIGAVGLPINTYLKPHDYQYFIADSGARVVIVDHSLVPAIEQIRSTITDVREIITTGAAVAGYPFFDDMVATQPSECESLSVDPDSMAFWLYSSGSTGMPKGVVHTGNHIFWATELFGLGALGINSDDVILSPPKMYFAFGLGN
ncbi:MAG: AMP-binding protein, partial [Pseudorhodoplanes sp.]